MTTEKNTYLHHISLAAPGEVLQQVVEFYDLVLGLKPGPRPDFGIAGHWLYADEQPIIHLIEDPGRAPEQSGHFDHIALRCPDIDAVISRLNENDIAYSRMDMTQLNQAQLFLRDPAGISVELIFCV